MADIAKLTRLLNGEQRQVDLSASGNSLRVDSIKIGASSLEIKETAGALDFSALNLQNIANLAINGQLTGAIHNVGSVSGAAVAVDWDNSNIQRMTLTGDVTSLAFSNGKDGGQYILIIDQDGTGGHSVTFTDTIDGIEFIGPAPSIKTGAGERSIVSFIYDASKTNEYQGFSDNEVLGMSSGGTGANLSPVAGSVVYTDADSMELLAPGSDNDVLTYDSGGNAPVWESPKITSAGAGDSGALVRLDAGGKIDGTMIDSSDVDHDLTTNFVANEHIDHTSVTLSAGAGLSGGGDISANRSFAVDINSETSATVALGDEILMSDVDDSNNIKKTTASAIANLADHDALTNFVADEHVAHSSVSVVAASDAGVAAANNDLSSNIGLALDIDGLTAITVVADADTIAIDDGDAGVNRKITRADFIGSAAITMEASTGIDMGANKITNVGTPTADDDAATKGYVDGLASGLDPKESVRVATTAVLSGTMTADDVAPTTGNRSYDTTAKTISWFTAEGPTALDGVTLANGDRILVKDESATSGPSAGEGRIYNGIYVRTSQDVWTRAGDHDGTPANEVSGGNFTFVELGTQNINSGWVLQGDGILTLQTDNIVFVQFSGSGTFSANDGVKLVGSEFSLDVDGISLSATTLASGDLFAIDNGGSNKKITIDNMLGDGLELRGSAMAVNAADFAGNGLEEDSANDMKLAFDGLTAGALATGDFLAFHDADEASADVDHKKITIDNLLAGIAGDGLIASATDIDVNPGDGIQIIADAVAVDVSAFAGLGLEDDGSENLKLAYDLLAAETTMATGDFLSFHDIDAAAAADHKKITLANFLTQLAGDGLASSGTDLDISVGDGIEIASDAVELDLNGIASTVTVIAAGDKLPFADASATGANAGILVSDLLGDGLEVRGDSFAVDVSAIAGDGLEDDGLDNLKVDINGLTAASISDTDELMFELAAGGLRKITRADLLGNLSQISESMVAGEGFAANTSFLVRMAVSGETAGRVYKADNDASSNDNFYIIGIAHSTSAVTAGQNIDVYKLGEYTLGSSDTAFTAAADEGKPVFLGSNGAFTLTAPSAANTAVARIGTVRNVGGSSAIEIQPGIVGVN